MGVDVKRGDIIKVNFNPQAGYEQRGWRPAYVISPSSYNRNSNFVLVCPITNTSSTWPFAVDLEDSLKTTGKVYIDQLKSLDLNTRGFQYIEEASAEFTKDILERLAVLVR